MWHSERVKHSYPILYILPHPYPPKKRHLVHFFGCVFYPTLVLPQSPNIELLQGPHLEPLFWVPRVKLLSLICNILSRFEVSYADVTQNVKQGYLSWIPHIIYCASQLTEKFKTCLKILKAIFHWQSLWLWCIGMGIPFQCTTLLRRPTQVCKKC